MLYQCVEPIIILVLCCVEIRSRIPGVGPGITPNFISTGMKKVHENSLKKRLQRIEKNTARLQKSNRIPVNVLEYIETIERQLQKDSIYNGYLYLDRQLPNFF